MNNTTIINTFNCDNSSIANIETQHRQIITTIAKRILKYKPMIKKPLVTDNTFFTVSIFSKINPFTQISSIVIQNL